MIDEKTQTIKFLNKDEFNDILSLDFIHIEVDYNLMTITCILKEDFNSIIDILSNEY